MHIELFDYISGNSLGVTQGVDFKDVIQNQHCVKPIVLKFVRDVETPIFDFILFLENKGQNKESNFFYYIDPLFRPSLESGSNLFQTFIEVPNAIQTSYPGGVHIGTDGDTSYYVWLDVQSLNQIGVNIPNFRLFFDF
jgi:hypothetical protein